MLPVQIDVKNSLPLVGQVSKSPLGLHGLRPPNQSSRSDFQSDHLDQQVVRGLHPTISGIARLLNVRLSACVKIAASDLQATSDRAVNSYTATEVFESTMKTMKIIDSMAEVSRTALILQIITGSPPLVPTSHSFCQDSEQGISIWSHLRSLSKGLGRKSFELTPEQFGADLQNLSELNCHLRERQQQLRNEMKLQLPLPFHKKFENVDNKCLTAQVQIPTLQDPELILKLRSMVALGHFFHSLANIFNLPYCALETLLESGPAESALKGKLIDILQRSQNRLIPSVKTNLKSLQLSMTLDNSSGSSEYLDEAALGDRISKMISYYQASGMGTTHPKIEVEFHPKTFMISFDSIAGKGIEELIQNAVRQVSFEKVDPRISVRFIKDSNSGELTFTVLNSGSFKEPHLSKFCQGLANPFSLLADSNTSLRGGHGASLIGASFALSGAELSIESQPQQTMVQVKFASATHC